MKTSVWRVIEAVMQVTILKIDGIHLIWRIMSYICHIHVTHPHKHTQVIEAVMQVALPQNWWNLFDLAHICHIHTNIHVMQVTFSKLVEFI